jgi:RimJ/RimL family protein N-acetyltransferase
MNDICLKNSKFLSISRAHPDDASIVIDFVNQIAGETDNLTFGGGEFHLSVDQEKQYFLDLQKSKNSIFIIGKIDSQIVSVADLSSSPIARLEHAGVIGLSVMKDYWHIGVGTAMLQYLISWAEQSKIIRKINLGVRTSNLRAITLYRRMGFIEEGIKTRSMYINQKFCDTLKMGLNID